MVTMQNFAETQFELKYKLYAKSKYNLAAVELDEDRTITHDDLRYPNPNEIKTLKEYDQAEWEVYWKEISAYEEELATSDGKGTKATKPPTPKLKTKIGPYKIIMQKEYEQERINALRNEQKYHDDKKAMFADMLTFLDGPLRSAVMNDQDYQRAKTNDDVRKLMTIIRQNATGEGVYSMYVALSEWFGLQQKETTRESYVQYCDEYIKSIEKLERISQNDPDILKEALFNVKFVVGLQQSMFQSTIDELSEMTNWTDYRSLMTKLSSKLNMAHGLKNVLATTKTNTEGVITVDVMRTDDNRRSNLRPRRTCFNCGRTTNHMSSDCPEPPTTCRKCGEKGHMEDFCDAINKRMTEEPTRRPRQTDNNYYENRNYERKPRFQERNVKRTNRFMKAKSADMHAIDDHDNYYYMDEDEDDDDNDDDHHHHVTENDDNDNREPNYSFNYTTTRSRCMKIWDDEALTVMRSSTHHNTSHVDTELFAIDSACIGAGHMVRDASLLFRQDDTATMRIQGYDGESKTTYTVGTVLGLGKAAVVPNAPNNLINLRKLCHDIEGTYEGNANQITIFDKNGNIYAVGKDHGDGFLSTRYQDIKHHRTPNAHPPPLPTSFIGRATGIDEPIHLTPEETQRAHEARTLCPRMGHPGYKAIYRALRENALANTHLTCVDLTNALRLYGPCQACKEGKMNAPPTRTISTSPPASHVGQRIYADIKTFNRNESPVLGGFTGYLFTVDEKSSYILCIGLASKAKVLDSLKSLIATYRAYGYTVSTIRTDDEHAFTSHRQALGSLGIRLETTPAGMHNRRCERYIQTHGKICRSIRASLPYELPSELALELVHAAARSMNSSCSSVSRTKTPLQLVTGQRPTIPKYIFGQPGLVYSPRKDEDRLAEWGIFIRERSEKHDYAIYFPMRRGVLYSRRKFEATTNYPKEWGLTPRIRVMDKRRSVPAGAIPGLVLQDAIPPMSDATAQPISTLLRETHQQQRHTTTHQPTDDSALQETSFLLPPPLAASSTITDTEGRPQQQPPLPQQPPSYYYSNNPTITSIAAQEGGGDTLPSVVTHNTPAAALLDIVGHTTAEATQSPTSSTEEPSSQPTRSSLAQEGEQQHKIISSEQQSMPQEEQSDPPPPPAIALRRRWARSSQPSPNNLQVQQQQQPTLITTTGRPKRRAAMTTYKDGGSAMQRAYEQNAKRTALTTTTTDEYPSKHPSCHQQQAAVYRISLAQALKDENNKDITMEAVKAEFTNLLVTQKALEPVLLQDIPQVDKDKIINGHIFFKDKEDITGKQIRKGRFVLNGNEQDPYHIDETRAPTINPISIMTTLAVSCRNRNATNDAYDVVGAFVCTDMPAGKVIIVRMRGKTVNMVTNLFPSLCPFVSEDNCLYCYLKKFIYGLAEAAKEFNKKLTGIILSMGFRRSKADECLFIKAFPNGQKHILGIHVDDIYSMAPNKQARQQFEKQLRTHLEVKSQYDRVTYLGMNIQKQPDGTIYVHQHKFMKDIIERYEVMAKPLSTPARPDLISNNATPEAATLLDNKSEYIGIIMSVMYLARYTRPDILFAVTYLATKCKQPSLQDMHDVWRVLRYIKGTMNKGLIFQPTKERLRLTCYADASHLLHPDGLGHSGFLATIGGTVIMARSAKQKLQGRSSSETELISTEECSTYVVWLRQLCAELMGLNGWAEEEGPTTIYQDNKSSIMMASQGNMTFKRSKHMIGRVSYLAERIREGDVQLSYLETSKMLADCLTKPVSKEILQHACEGMGIRDIRK